MERGYLRDGAVFLGIGILMVLVQVLANEYSNLPFFGREVSALQLPEQQTMIYASIIEAFLGVLLWILIAGNTHWEEQLETLKQNRGYILASGGLLVMGALSGLLFGESLWFISQPLIDHLTALAESASKLTLSYFVVFIFGNNVGVAVAAGIFIALIPLIGLLFPVVSALLNGLLLGSIHEATGVPFWHVLIGTMPHGILEIPAFVLSIAVGMKVNMLVLKGISDLVHSPGGFSKKEGIEEKLKDAIDTMKLFYVIVPMFLLAAIIESLISIWLINAL